MRRTRLAAALLAVALTASSSALGAVAAGGAPHSADSVGQHGKSPVHHAPTPSIGNGPLPAPSPLAPGTSQSFAASRKQGHVRVRAGGPHGPATFRQLTRDADLPFGAVIDALHGTVALTVARGATGKPQVVELTGGLFSVRQHGRNPVTDLALSGGDFAGCPVQARRAAPAKATAVAATVGHTARRRSRHSVVRRLWARDDHGRFMTYGATSVATVRGTVWLTEDRCDGTLTRVFRGRVSVHDSVRNRTVVIAAGHAYLARRG
jgi:hypothetical protein